MEKEDLKIINRGLEDEMVYVLLFLLFNALFFSLIKLIHSLSFCAGVERVSAVPMEAGSGGFGWTLYRWFPFPAALLDA